MATPASVIRSPSGMHRTGCPARDGPGSTLHHQSTRDRFRTIPRRSAASRGRTLHGGTPGIPAAHERPRCHPTPTRRIGRRLRATRLRSSTTMGVVDGRTGGRRRPFLHEALDEPVERLEAHRLAFGVHDLAAEGGQLPPGLGAKPDDATSIPGRGGDGKPFPDPGRRPSDSPRAHSYRS